MSRNSPDGPQGFDPTDARNGCAASDEGESPAAMECGICWYVYDPAHGDPVWQVPPGVSFDRLPDRWSCPECDAPRHKFLRVER